MEPDLVKLTRVEESLVTITCRAMRARWGGVLLAAVAMLLLLVSRCERDHAAAHRRRAFAVGDALSTLVEGSLEVAGLVESALSDEGPRAEATSALISAGTGGMHEPRLHYAASRALFALRQKISEWTEDSP